MIPDREELERLYSHSECEWLDQMRRVLEAETDLEKRAVMGRKALRTLWGDELEYIEKTHWIKTKSAVPSLLRLNYAQKRFYRDVILRSRQEKVPVRAICLKARQLGYSTFIQAWQYEQCDRNDVRTALTISYDEPSTRELFAKAKFLHKRLWFPRKPKRESKVDLEFEDNGSTFFARTSGNLSAGRGDTFHHLHLSEVPMWSAAEETLTSVLQTVPTKAITSVFFESTAKGAVGPFYDRWQKAERGEGAYIPFFAPWYWDPEYALDFQTPDHQALFGRSLDPTERRLQAAHSLTLEQVYWRRQTIKDSCEGSEAKFRQEYPSTASEAFLTSGTPVFNPEAVATLEQNTRPPEWRGTIALIKQ